MKKILTVCTVLALAFAMSFSFTACDNGGGGGGDDPGPIKPGLYAKTGVTGKDTPIDIEGATPENMVAVSFFYMNARPHPGTYTLVLEADNNVDPWELNDSLTLIGIGGTRNINLNHEGSLFTVNSTASLTLGENITLKGIRTNTDALVEVKGTLIMKSGSVITGNTNAEGKGGGVYLNEGTFTMSGGAIIGNDAQNGGGVYVIDGTFNMFGGEIKGNHAETSGGGVYLSYHPNEAFLHMAGGTIYGGEAAAGSDANTADGYYNEYGRDTPPGRAVYVTAEGFTVDYGTLSDNTFTMKGDLPVEFNDERYFGGVIETTIKVNNGILIPFE